MSTDDRLRAPGHEQDDPEAHDPLDSLLGNLQGESAPLSEKADLGALLGGLSGGGAPAGGEADLGGLLGGLLGGGSAQGGEADLGALLGGLLGGGGAAGGGQADLGALLGGLGGPGTAPAGGGADLGALLGGLLGGGANQGMDSPDDFVSSALGGGQSGGGLLGSLLGGLLGGSSPSSGVTASGGVTQALLQAALGFLLQALANPQRSGVDSTDVMARLGNGTLDTDYVRQSGLAAQFSQEANVDEETAAQTLEMALRAMGGLAR